MRNRKEMLIQGACGLLAVLVVMQLPGLLSLGASFGELRPSRPAEAAVETARSDSSPATNSPTAMAAAPGLVVNPPPGMPMPGMPPRGGRPSKAVELPAEVKARVDFIVGSELLGPVPRPLPMAVLGIAGGDVLFRAPDGQTGLLTEGGELGGVKLLRIGTNRILIEHEGQQKELTLFSGYGGESLLPQKKETSK
ncbi:MAG TPA: hypothetical protein DCY13_22860 [Verrucomicrobiales bacterium]|nr:hypothetical protein [Verrucomicrobiales bacterium]